MNNNNKETRKRCNQQRKDKPMRKKDKLKKRKPRGINRENYLAAINLRLLIFPMKTSFLQTRKDNSKIICW